MLGTGESAARSNGISGCTFAVDVGRSPGSDGLRPGAPGGHAFRQSGCSLLGGGTGRRIAQCDAACGGRSQSTLNTTGRPVSQRLSKQMSGIDASLFWVARLSFAGVGSNILAHVDVLGRPCISRISRQPGVALEECGVPRSPLLVIQGLVLKRSARQLPALREQFGESVRLSTCPGRGTFCRWSGRSRLPAPSRVVGALRISR